MKFILSIFSLALVVAVAAPAVASAQSFTVTTPYNCGAYWSSYPCPAQAEVYVQQPAYYPQNQYNYQYVSQYTYQPQYQYPAYYPQTNTCAYNSAYCTPAAPTIASVNPSKGEVGDTVIVYGSGFSQRDNSVRFGRGIISGLLSQDGRTLSFVIPAQLNGYNSQPTVTGSYDVSVVTADGRTTGTMPFTVLARWYMPLLNGMYIPFWGSSY